ncbi:proline-rich protein 2-like [Neofelis nebulosa]|uniref:proline-rich protein 2-like n=1 Tax=Neofelis nebulosa TaxID=61452 RepID=UPI00272B1F02|nr:proline-rich protein 2-like [Neofelis nebulosa]
MGSPGMSLALTVMAAKETLTQFANKLCSHHRRESPGDPKGDEIFPRSPALLGAAGASRGPEVRAPQLGPAPAPAPPPGSLHRPDLPGAVPGTLAAARPGMLPQRRGARTPSPAGTEPAAHPRAADLRARGRQSLPHQQPEAPGSPTPRALETASPPHPDRGGASPIPLPPGRAIFRLLRRREGGNATFNPLRKSRIQENGSQALLRRRPRGAQGGWTCSGLHSHPPTAPPPPPPPPRTTTTTKAVLLKSRSSCRASPYGLPPVPVSICKRVWQQVLARM